MPQKPVKTVFDADTGEKAGDIYEGDRIVRGQSLDYLQSTMEILPGEPFIKMYARPLSFLAESMSGPEMNLIYMLLPHLGYESGMLQHSNGQPITREYISGLTGQSERTIDRLLQGLRDKQIIGRNVVGRDVQYFANPYLFQRGRRINKTLHDMFKKSRWAKIHDFKGAEAE